MVNSFRSGLVKGRATVQGGVDNIELNTAIATSYEPELDSGSDGTALNTIMPTVFTYDDLGLPIEGEYGFPVAFNQVRIDKFGFWNDAGVPSGFPAFRNSVRVDNKPGISGVYDLNGNISLKANAEGRRVVYIVATYTLADGTAIAQVPLRYFSQVTSTDLMTLTINVKRFHFDEVGIRSLVATQASQQLGFPITPADLQCRVSLTVAHDASQPLESTGSQLWLKRVGNLPATGGTL